MSLMGWPPCRYTNIQKESHAELMNLAGNAFSAFALMPSVIVLLSLLARQVNHSRVSANVLPDSQQSDHRLVQSAHGGTITPPASQMTASAGSPSSPMPFLIAGM